MNKCKIHFTLQYHLKFLNQFDLNQLSINTVMQHLIKLFKETKKLNSDLTQYEFSTDFLNKKKSYFASLKQRNLYPSYKTLVQLSHTYSNLSYIIFSKKF